MGQYKICPFVNIGTWNLCVSRRKLGFEVHMIQKGTKFLTTTHIGFGGWDLAWAPKSER